MSETYVAARERLLSELAARGWETRPHLKRPWAQRDGLRLNFHAQAVYLHEHSLWVDIRGMAVDAFIAHVVRASALRNDENYRRG